MENQLARKITLPLLTFYGLGTILGAGIYVLVGKVSEDSASFAPLSFLLAASIAWITAKTYSQLTVIFPQSAGPALYVKEIFSINSLSILMGLMVIFTGIVSSATLASGFMGYFKLLLPIPDLLGIILIVTILSAVAIWGISESLILSAVITVLEVGGLLFILILRAEVLLELPSKTTEMFLPQSFNEIFGIFGGAFLAFYAFVGFEDMVNVVEEVKEVNKTMPRAIFLAVLASAILYVLVSLVAVLALPLRDLVISEAPLADMLKNHHDRFIPSIAVISAISIVNGILIQIIMASRVIYGMAKLGNLPKVFAQVNSKTQTPIFSTLLVSCLILVFSLTLPLVSLAKMTSFITLIIFSVVHFSLWRLKQRAIYREQMRIRSYPFLGMLLCLALLFVQIYKLF